MAKDYVAKYEKKYGARPDAMGALGYDTVLVLVDAIKRAGGTDSAKLREALAQTKDVEGVTGKITIDSERNARKPAVIIGIKGGKFVYHSTISP